MSALYNFGLAEYFMVPERFYTLFNVLLVVLLLIVLLLKGLALWRSARLGQNVWFWVFMFVNTLGILEIVYLIIYRDGFKDIDPKEKKEKKKIKFSLKRKEKKDKKDEKVEEKKEEAKIEEPILSESQVSDLNNWV